MKTASFLFSLLAIAAIFGCRTAGTAARIEQRKVIGITSATIGEYTIPVLSIAEGPSVSVYQSKEVPSEVTIEGNATTTNTTSALGIYTSEERKSMVFSGTFKLTASTNTCRCVQGGTNSCHCSTAADLIK